MNALLDTNILVDIGRRYVPALTWLQNSSHLIFGIPSIVRMELVLGTQSKVEMQKTLSLIQPYGLVYLNETDAHWAMLQFEQFHLSHRVGILDCFIAALGVRLKLPIYSRNVKDLGAFPGVQVIAPYP